MNQRDVASGSVADDPDGAATVRAERVASSLEQDGFVVTPLLDKAEVDGLLGFYDELALQAALRDGKLSRAELQRGLATGKLQAEDIKEALASGSLSVESLKKGVASRAIVAEDLERTLRDAHIDSSDLNNAIEHHRLPAGEAPGAAPPP